MTQQEKSHSSLIKPFFFFLWQKSGALSGIPISGVSYLFFTLPTLSKCAEFLLIPDVMNAFFFLNSVLGTSQQHLLDRCALRMGKLKTRMLVCFKPALPCYGKCTCMFSSVIHFKLNI